MPSDPLILNFQVTPYILLLTLLFANFESLFFLERIYSGEHSKDLLNELKIAFLKVSAVYFHLPSFLSK